MSKWHAEFLQFTKEAQPILGAPPTRRYLELKKLEQTYLLVLWVYVEYPTEIKKLGYVNVNFNKNRTLLASLGSTCCKYTPCVALLDDKNLMSQLRNSGNLLQDSYERAKRLGALLRPFAAGPVAVTAAVAAPGPHQVVAIAAGLGALCATDACVSHCMHGRKLPDLKKYLAPVLHLEWEIDFSMKIILMPNERSFRSVPT